MPPEQLQNPRDVDKRSDIWSLGATLYELLCGRPPFEGPGYLELASRILSQPPVPLSQQPVPGTLPHGLENILRKCLEKDREARYANAAELAAALAPFGSDDARVSLGRVAGMFQSSSSIPALTRSVPMQDAVACTATLEVPVEARQSPDDRRTSDIGAIASAPAPRARRHWLVLGAAALLLPAAFLLRGALWVTPRSSDASLLPTKPAAAVAPIAEAVVAPTPAAEPARAPAVELPAAPAVDPTMAGSGSSTQAVRAGQGALERGLEKVVSAPRTTELERVNVRRSLAPPPTAPSADASTAAPAPTAPVAPADSAVAPEPSSSSPGLGRSAEIERLIEKRF
jgi:serine/threonine-protein kinase